MHIQESGEMYLEAIFVLSQKKTAVRSIDVAEYLNYSKPSVSRAVGLLKNGGFLCVESDGSLKLSELGLEVARKIYDRHTLISGLLIKLGVDEETATEDACKIEHHLSDKSYEAIKKFSEKLG